MVTGWRSEERLGWAWRPNDGVTDIGVILHCLYCTISMRSRGCPRAWRQGFKAYWEVSEDMHGMVWVY
jgi:hypothetical protein